VNHTITANAFYEASSVANGVKFDVLLLVADSTLYIKKVAERLYPELIYVACVAHSLQRVCETIHVFYTKLTS
jgi:hypothetical protein